MLLDEIAAKLLRVNNDASKHETTITITGAGGFGKTTTVISLCYHPIVHNQFTDGFLFIELGPQATDPSVKLRAIYNLLTDQQCDINVVEQKVNQLTWEYYRNLLVIIDDVWHVEDAEPLVRAFLNCKIILTTRMKDIEHYIPAQNSVTIGPMSMCEAVSLLTNGIIDNSQLSQEDVSLLNELAEDAHLWPLLLSLIRGQLSHNLKQYHLSYHEAIQNLQTKLHHKGLTAFDKNTCNITTINRSRKLAVKACIEMTLELLTKLLSDKIKILILWTGIGTSLQTAVLHILWNISKQEVEDSVDALWAYGLVQFTDIIISPKNIKQRCVEVHAIISQYIIEYIDYEEFIALLSSYSSSSKFNKELISTFQQSYGVHDLSSLTALDYLNYKLSEIENIELPLNVRLIYMRTVADPHCVIKGLQLIKKAIMNFLYTINLNEQISSLLGDCKQIIKNVNKLCRKLNQSVQRNLYEQKYDELIQTIDEFIKTYPICILAQKAVAMVKMIIPYCDGNLLHFMRGKCELLQFMTSDYNQISTFILPRINLFIKYHKKITSSLHNGSPDIELTHHYFMSDKPDKEDELITNNYLIKMQEVAPIFIQDYALHHMK